MKWKPSLRRVVAAVLGIACAATSAAACQDERITFEQPQTRFETDAAPPDVPVCGHQCSIDGRSVIDVCTGTVVETCPPEKACGAAECQEPCAAAAADRSSNGCEFYFQMPRYRKEFPRNCYAAYVVNTSQSAAHLSLELGGSAVDLAKSIYDSIPGTGEFVLHEGDVAAGDGVVVFLSDREPGAPPEFWDYAYRVPCPASVTPASSADPIPEGTGLGTSFHLTSNVPISTTTVYPFGGARSRLPSATLVLPVASWTREHMIVDGWEFSNCGAPATQIIASEDGTDITLTPKTDVLDGNGVIGGLANSTLQYRLAKGQFIQFVQDVELTGSILTSSKPTTVIGGHTCAWVPTPIGTGDILGQQIPGYEQWGSEYVGVGYRPRLGNEHEPMIYRIVAARDGTRLDYDPAVPPGAPVTMAAGEVAAFQSGTGDAFVVRTQDPEHPIYVAAYMTGGSAYLSSGDPEFVNVVPAGQYLNAYGFYADSTYYETSLVVVRAKANAKFEDVWLECAGVLTNWQPIGTRGQYEFVRVDLERHNGPGDTFGASTCTVGVQRMKSNGPFTATLWGWGDDTSYAVPGGMAQRKLVSQPLAGVH